MVQFITFAITALTAASGAMAFDQACNPNQILCGFTYNNVNFGYTRDELIASLRANGFNPNIPGVVEHTLYNCTDTEGTIAPVQFCGNGLCRPTSQEGISFNDQCQ